MARPRLQHPTPAELEILQVLWQRGPGTVRDVMQDLRGARPRAYTSIMSLMNTMAMKRQLHREPRGKAFVYSAAAPREATLAQMVADLVNRAFLGSAGALVAHLLTETSQDELDEIQRTIAAYKRKRGRS